VTRAEELFSEARALRYRRTSRMFLWLLLGQWAFAVGLALALGAHLVAAIGLGAAVNVAPIVLIRKRPEAAVTRQVIAAVQMLWSALIILISGGHDDAYVHVFGSLAFLAFYRDWKVLPPATAIVVLVCGTDNSAWWQSLEHAALVAFEDVILVWACLRGVREMRAAATREASLEQMDGTDAIPFDYSINELAAEVHDDDRARVIAAFAGFRGMARGPLEFRLRQGGTQYAHMRAFLGHRRGSRVRGVMFDDTRRKKLEHELRHAQQLESIGRIAAGVAHEINTPIQFVGDSVEFASVAFEAMLEVAAGLRERDEDIEYIVGELPRALERMRDGAERVAHIVRSMKVFARAPQPVMELVDLNAAIESTLVIARNEYKYVADLKLDLEQLPQVACHVGEINQVMLNMIVNAAHAVAETRRRGTITVKTRADDRYVVISISDDGCGIPDTARDKIFEPFFTTKPVGKGTGQGLAIARSVIVDGHGGKLTYRSVVGHGTTFHVRIPLEPCQQLGVAA
jgi:signal transduction histidine kinase